MFKTPITRVSTVMMGVTAALAAAQLTAYGYLWFDRGGLAETIEREILPAGTPYVLTPTTATVGLLIAALPVAVSLWGLWQAFTLFRLYRKGAVFTDRAAACLKRMGLALGMLPFAQTVTTGAVSLVLTMDNPPGQRQLAITLSDSHLTIGVAGALLVVIGWVMGEAARIAQENSEIV